MRRAAFLLLAACAATSLAIAAEPKPASIPLERVLGTWRGFSICAGERAACKDERVRYHVTRATSGPWPVIVTAEKLVGASWDTMGVTEMSYDATRGGLSREFEIGTTHGLLRFRLAGDALDRMEGTLVTLPDSALGRIMEASRDTSRGVPAREPDSVFAPVEWLVGGTWHGSSTVERRASFMIQQYAWRNDRVAVHVDLGLSVGKSGTGPVVRGFFAYNPVTKEIVYRTIDGRAISERIALARANENGFELPGETEWNAIHRTGPDAYVRDSRTIGAAQDTATVKYARTGP